MVQIVTEYGVVGRASDNGIVSIGCQDPREFTTDIHRTVDDRPYGGGPGMVMKFEPLAAARGAAKRRVPEGAPVVFLTPQGARFDQATAERYAALPGIILLAGRYEGREQRLIEAHVDEELSLGDFVMSGGEIAVMAVVDSVARLLPGVLGTEESVEQESFVDGMFDHPHYTRPEEIAGRRVPDVLLSGDHARIARWRYQQALGRTFVRRPELVAQLRLTDEQRTVLDEYLKSVETV